MKFKRIIPMLCAALLATTTTAYAGTITETDLVDSSKNVDVKVTAEINSTFTVSLPSSIELTENGENYTYSGSVGVKGDIDSGHNVLVVPSDNITMHDVTARPEGILEYEGYTHKDPVVGTISQLETAWDYTILSSGAASGNFTYDDATQYQNTSFTVTTPKLSAGDWEGALTYNISLSPAGPVLLTLGETYSFSGYNWVAAEQGDGYVTLQSTGVTSGAWPGYAMTGTLTNAAGSTITLTDAGTAYTRSIDGYDISNYDSTTQSLYSSIQAAEYTSATYGKGLFLISNEKAGSTTNNSQGSGNYWTALKTAAANKSSFGASYGVSWLGTVGGGVTWSVSSNGNASNSYQNNPYVLAPAFNLDTSKVRLNGNTITIK